MASSGSDKLFPNQHGFPTPNTAPDEQVCRVLSLPAQEDYLALAMGALDALRKPYNWFKNGDLTPDEAAALFADILDAAYEQALSGQCDPDIPTPFWDTPEDADDSVPVGEQVWYGVAVVTYASPPEVTFVEQLGIWAIAGFIAYSGAVGGAIAFLTIAPKFVIALKTGDLGGVVDLIVDASRVGRYNTYSPSPGVLRIPVVGNPDLDEHQIYLVKDDDPDTVVEVVRDELNPNDVAPSNRRYVVDTDEVQIQGADGTWGDNAGADPRSSPAYVYPVITADDPACQAANNMARWINNLIDQVLLVIAECNDAAGLLTVLVGLLLELGPFGILIDLVLALAFVLFSAGATALDAAFTPDVYDHLACIFYCNVDSLGQMSPEQLSNAQAQIDTEIGGLVGAVLDAMLFLMGNVGLTNAGTVGAAPADCSSCVCEWCWVWDKAALDAGHDWTHSEDETYGQVYNNAPGGSFSFVFAELIYSWNGVDGGTGSGAVIRIDGTNLVEQIPLFGGSGTLTYDDVVVIPNTILIGGNTATTGGGGVFDVVSFKLKGTGALPAFTDGIEC